MSKKDDEKVASQLPKPSGYKILIALPNPEEKTEGGILWWTYYNEDCVFFKGNAIFKSTVNTVHATSIRIISLTPY